MTDNIQRNTQADIQEVLEAKFKMDEQIISAIVDEVEKTFTDPKEANIISRLAVKLYHVSSDIEEMNVQEMYTATVLDALTKILVDDLGIIPKEVLEQAVKEAHDIAKESIEEANRIAFQLEENKQTGNTPASEVTTI